MKQLRTIVMFAVAVAVSCTVRVLQVLCMTDPATGFYYPRFEMLGVALTLLYVSLIFTTAVISLSEMKGCVKVMRGNIGFSAVMFVAAAVMLYVATLDISGTAGILKGLFAIGSAAYFAAEGLGERVIRRDIRRWLSIFPVVFWLAEIITNFLLYTRMANISENVFDMLSMSLFCLFFLFYGRFGNGYATSKGVKLLTPVGLTAAMVGFLASVPRYVAALFPEISALHPSSYPAWVFIVFGVAVICLLPRRVSSAETEVAEQPE